MKLLDCSLDKRSIVKDNGNYKVINSVFQYNTLFIVLLGSCRQDLSYFF